MTKAKDELKQALKKDFHKLYVKQFSTDYEAQRMVRGIEIDVMSLDNVEKLIAAQNLALLTRLEAEPTIADLFPTHPENNPDGYDDMVSVVKWYKSKLQSERALIEKRMM